MTRQALEAFISLAAAFVMGLFLFAAMSILTGLH